MDQHTHRETPICTMNGKTLNINNQSDKLNHEVIKGTVWVGLCIKAFALSPRNANAQDASQG